MDTDTSKATGRPWYEPAPCAECGLNPEIHAIIDPAALEALVAERDALRAKLDASGVGCDALRGALLSTLDDMSLLVTGRCPHDLVAEIWERACATRAALQGKAP